MGKALILSAPSGSGKTTIVQYLLEKFPSLAFSISAASRAPRGKEQDGKDYYFMSPEAFREKIAQGDFLEWEEVYAGSYYGTTKSEANRIWEKGRVMVCDIDVKGGLALKKKLGKEALALFIQPPSVAALEERLKARATDSAEAIAKRIAKAEEELAYAPQFDEVIVNDVLENACKEAEKIVADFIG